MGVRKADARDIDVTPAMIDAGAEAIFRLREEMTAWTL
jgi:hypothetical protein